MSRIGLDLGTILGSLARHRAAQALGLTLAGALLLAVPSEARRVADRREAWETYTHTVLLKDRQITFTFEYPAGWYVIPEGLYVSVQNVPPFNTLSDLPGGLPEGFVKISYMLDPKASPSVLLEGRGEAAVLGAVAWQRLVETGGKAGDRTVTLERVQDGVVFRVFAYVTRTEGQAEVLSRHTATLDRAIASLRIQPAVRLPEIPGAPPYPAGGKPEATPMGEPIVP